MAKCSDHDLGWTKSAKVQKLSLYQQFMFLICIFGGPLCLTSTGDGIFLEFMIGLLSIYEPWPLRRFRVWEHGKATNLVACGETNKSEMLNNKSESREEQIRRCGLSVGGMSVCPRNTEFWELNMHEGGKTLKLQLHQVFVSTFYCNRWSCLLIENRMILRI